jgi:hypothetical protein
LPDFLNLIFHNYVLFFEFKYKLIIMQLRLHPRNNKKLLLSKLLTRAFLVILVFSLLVFLANKIEMPVPSKLIKQEISNDKLITLK